MLKSPGLGSELFCPKHPAGAVEWRVVSTFRLRASWEQKSRLLFSALPQNLLAQSEEFSEPDRLTHAPSVFSSTSYLILRSGSMHLPERPRCSVLPPEAELLGGAVWKGQGTSERAEGERPWGRRVGGTAEAPNRAGFLGVWGVLRVACNE